jgi:hypothetical protein
MVRCGPYPTAGPWEPLDRVAQIAERKYCRPQARPFRLGFPRKVPVFPICPPAAVVHHGLALRPQAKAALALPVSRDPEVSDEFAPMCRHNASCSSRSRGRAGGSWARFLLAWWLLAGSIAPHAFGRRHWSIAKAWASTPGFRNARWRFRNGLFRRRRDGAGSADDPDWTWRRLLLLTEQPLTGCPVQHPPSVHHRASGPSVFSWCSVTSTS